jgi:DNA-binding transcriptional MerR regulator
MSTAQAPMTVAALAHSVGVRPDTIRYYERIGLLRAPTRTAADHRRYDADAIDRLWFIHGMKRLGLRLVDIRDLLALRETGTCPCGPAASLLRHRLEQVDAEIAKLIEFRDELAGFVEQIPGEDCPEPVPGTWRPRREVPA